MGVAAVVRILLVFCLILLAIKRKWSLGNAFTAGAAALGLVFAMSPAAIVVSMVKAVILPKTLALSVVVSLILVLSHSMEQAGQMQQLLDSFTGLVRRPLVNLATFPSLIGLLPMPGGAVFSAPMVKVIGQRRGLSPVQMSFLNYWFRHIWEYWWPLYPGVLLATALADIDLWHYVAVMLPLTAAAVACGLVALRNSAAIGKVLPADDGRRPSPRAFFHHLGPIVLVIVGGLGAGFGLSALVDDHAFPVAKECGLILALVAAIFWVWHRAGMDAGRRWAVVRQRKLVEMFYMVTAILVFKGILEDSGAVARVSAELTGWHIPLVPICMVLPFLVGVVSGITIAFVGTTFPILLALIASFGQQAHVPAFLMLAMTAGFAGVLLSPLHLCLLLSNAFFKAPTLAVYRSLALPTAALVAAGLAYFGLLYYLGP